MVEAYPHVFEFTLVRGQMLFDFAQGKVVLKTDKGVEKEFPAPVNLHNFCVVIGGILYGKNITRKQFFFVGKPGERRVIEIRGVIYKKEIGEGKKVERPRIFVTFIDEKDNFKETFVLNIFNAYSLWEMFRAQDKVVSVDDMVFEKREGHTFIQNVPLPYQKAKSLFYALDTYLRENSLPAVNQEWEYGRLMLWSEKKRMDFFRRAGEEYIPSGVIKLNSDNALRIMSVL